MLSILNGLVQFLILVTVALSPWLYAATIPLFEQYLGMVIAVIAVLSSVRVIVAGKEILPTRFAGWVLAALFSLAVLVSVHLWELPATLVGSISPGRAHWVELASPNVPEQILGEVVAAKAPGSSVGFNVQGSYTFFVSLLAIAGLFFSVCSLEAPEKFLRQLAMTLSVSGTFLAFVAILQHFGTSKDPMYWSVASDFGRGFGPFFNRNHYPFYANMALGLTFGLLLERQTRFGKYWYRDLLQDGFSLWLLAAIILIAGSIVICVSRGGVVSLLIAILVALVASKRKRAVMETLQSGVVIGTCVSILFGWVGFSLAESRLSMLWEAERFSNDGRWFLWQAAMAGAMRFPLFGSGGETFQYWETIEQLGSRAWNSTQSMALRADNEFMDVACEYGFPAALVLVILTALVFWRGFAIAKTQPLCAGAFLGLTAVICHSVVDFGLRIPATGVIAATLLACLCSIRTPNEFAAPRQQNSVLENRFQALMVALAAVICSVALVAELRSNANAASLQSSGMAALQRGDLPVGVEEFEASVRLRPEDVAVQIGTARGLLLAAKLSDDAAQSDEWIRRSLVHCVKARELCPLAWEPQLWLAQYTEYLDAGDSQLAYLKRAELLHPSNPSTTFYAGKLAIESDELALGLEYWRGSLTYSSRHAREILEFWNKSALEPQKFVEAVFPQDPLAAYEVAMLAKQVWGIELAEPLYADAIRQLKAPRSTSFSLKLASWQWMLGNLYSDSGLLNEAIEQYRLALRDDIQNVPWRLQLARTLFANDDLQKAIRETRIALTFEPGNTSATRLMAELTKEQTLQKQTF